MHIPFLNFKLTSYSFKYIKNSFTTCENMLTTKCDKINMT